MKFLTKSIESSLCDYSDPYILVTGNIVVTKTITAAGGIPIQINQPLAAATQTVFKNCASFKDCRTEIMILLFIMQIVLILQCLCTI